MPRTDTTQSTANTARQAIITAMVNFTTSTLPPLQTTAAAAVNAMDPSHPTMGHFADEDAAFYRACVAYTAALIAKGRYAGPALRFP